MLASFLVWLRSGTNIADVNRFHLEIPFSTYEASLKAH